jgi:hypothetical protein
MCQVLPMAGPSTGVGMGVVVCSRLSVASDPSPSAVIQSEAMNLGSAFDDAVPKPQGGVSTSRRVGFAGGFPRCAPVQLLGQALRFAQDDQ